MLDVVGLFLNASIVGSLLIGNITVTQLAPYYFPNCNIIIYYWLDNNLIEFTNVPIEILPYSIETYPFSFNLQEYKSGKLKVEAYVSCERVNLYGNHIAFQGGKEILLIYNGTGQIPKVLIDKEKTRILGAKAQAGPTIEPGKNVYMDIALKAFNDFEGKLIINLCRWDNVIYRNCEKVYEKDIKLLNGEEKMYRIYTTFPEECDAYNYELVLVDKENNIHDIWTLRGVTKCMEIHYVYTYFTLEGYSVIVTGPYDPNWGEASGNVKIVSDNYSKTFYASMYTNEISELKDNVLLKNICIYINDKLIACNDYNLTKFEDRMEGIGETIKKYAEINVTEENITADEVTKNTTSYAILLVVVIIASVLLGLLLLIKKIEL